MSKNIYNHYVYRITNLNEMKHYIGLRSTKLPPEKDLGFKYFSSSKDKIFIQDQKNNPHNYKYKILKVFNNRKKAIEYEIYLHKKYDVGLNEKFYNRAKQTSASFDTSGTKIPESHKKAISKKLKNKPKKPETIKRMKDYYRNNPESASNRTKKRWDSYSDAERELFREKMSLINKDSIKNQKNSIGLKAKWNDINWRNKTIQSRKNKNPAGKPAIPVVINNIKYDSISQASAATGLSYRKIKKIIHETNQC